MMLQACNTACNDTSMIPN